MPKNCKDCFHARVRLKTPKTAEEYLEEKPGQLSIFGDLDVGVRAVFCELNRWTNADGHSITFPSLRVLEASGVGEKFAPNCKEYDGEE
jgi:hypothetical protein